jgi:hypothetical protein
LLTLIVGPSQESIEAGATKRELAERHHLRKRFWTGLLERARPRTKLHAARSPGIDTWIGAGAGKSGLAYEYVIGQHHARVNLYIDRGKGEDEATTAVFESLYANRQEIEEAYGDTLLWERLEGKRACRIRYDVCGKGYRDDEDTWEPTQDAMIDAMIRLEAALKPHIDALRI